MAGNERTAESTRRLPDPTGLEDELTRLTETLPRHIGQRIRWARGMGQILRADNPLFARGLPWPQRVCYFNAMRHFFYATPRLIFTTAPLVYLLSGLINIRADWKVILAYALPHLFLANLTAWYGFTSYRLGISITTLDVFRCGCGFVSGCIHIRP